MLELGCKLYVCFALFSFLGWVVETLLYVVRDRKVVKRGFLFGPICPIYGVGTIIAAFIMFMGITNVIWIFYIGMLLCGLLEYVTHFVMEKAFKAMWWDYSDRMFNLNGRIYLKGLLFFGIGMVLLVKFILPPVFYVLDLMPDWSLGLLTFIIYTVMIVDFTTTIADLMGTVNILKKALHTTISKSQEGLDDITTEIDKAKDKIKENEFVADIRNSIRIEHKTLSRIKAKYPDFDLQKYKDELAWYFGPESDTKGKEGIELHGDDNVKLDDEKDNKAV